MQVRLSTVEDLSEITEIVDEAKAYLSSQGIGSFTVVL